jgi:metal-sulfur cluster biosynthetic enzyme
LLAAARAERGDDDVVAVLEDVPDPEMSWPTAARHCA